MPINLALEFLTVTEKAAIAASHWIGKGEAKKADGAAVEAMRKAFNDINFQGTVVIGEGQKDEAPELYVGEKLGNNDGIEVDIAVDPLECTDSVAHGRYNALSVIVTGPKGSLFSAPDTYMDKIAAWGPASKVIDLDASVKDNVTNVAKALDKQVEDITVAILDRPRHEPIAKEVKETGGRVRMITDGDVATAIATCQQDSEVDLILGIGGSTEAVLAAAPVKMLGGELLCRFAPQNEKHEKIIADAGLDTKKIYTAEDLAQGDRLTFTATGIIDGPLLRGIVSDSHKTVTHSLVIRGRTNTVRYITTEHEHKNEH